MTACRGIAPLPIRLSDLSEQFAPYHLINTALNVEGSQESTGVAVTPTSSF